MLKFQKWVDRKVELTRAGLYPLIADVKALIAYPTPSLRSIIEQRFAALFAMSGEDALNKAVQRIWLSIEEIFTEKTSGLDRIMQDNLAADIYRSSSSNLRDFICLLAHTKLNLRILEVGAGTGGTTQTFLPLLANISSAPSYKLYTFTDISDGFFQKAKQNFAYAPNMQFKVFVISVDPLEQGFEAESYDLILASNVVHATPSIHDSLANLRTLLKADGHLVLTEISTTLSALDYIFGTLPGWWLG